MSQAKDSLSTARSRQLSDVEHLLQSCIQRTSDNLSKPFHFVGNTRQRLKSLAADMRRKMRTLRRWRSHVEDFSSRDLDNFLRDVVALRLEILGVRVSILLDTLDEVDSAMAKLYHCPDEVTCQRDAVGCEVLSLQGQLASTDTLDASEDKAASLETDILRLQDVVHKTAKSKTNRKTKAPSGLRSVRFEDNPEVNRVLRNAGRMRKLMKALREGGHMNIASNPDCVSNDLDVLQRQLSKIRQWENSEASFTKANVDDLEIIFTAIASHLKPDVDVDASSTSRSTPSTSRSSSSTSNKSADTGYSCPSPLTLESGIIKTDSFTQSGLDLDEVNASDNEDDDVIDERLI